MPVIGDLWAKTQIGPEDLALSGDITDGTHGDPDIVLTCAKVARSLLQEQHAPAPQEDGQQPRSTQCPLPDRE